VTVSIVRSGGRTAPPDRERLEITGDGEFTMWRSVRSPVVGRFAGRLPEGEASRVQSLVAAAAATEIPGGKQMPGAATETVTVDGAVLRTGSTGGPDGPWGDLLKALRALLGELTGHPAAAVAIEVGDGGSSASLRHRGDSPVTVDLSDLTVRAVVWGPGWEQRGEWSSAASGERASAAPGWSFGLPFDHGLEIGSGDALHVFARFGLVDGEANVAALAGLDPPPSA